MLKINLKSKYISDVWIETNATFRWKQLLFSFGYSICPQNTLNLQFTYAFGSRNAESCVHAPFLCFTANVCDITLVWSTGEIANVLF